MLELAISLISTVCPYDLEGVGNNSDGHELLAVVAAVHHERIGQSLDDRAVGLAESLRGISASGVRNIDGGSDLNVVAVKFPVSPLFYTSRSLLCPRMKV